MSFDSAKALQKATGRAKSDVANKIVSMFLHEVSRKVCLAGGIYVSDLNYRDSVISAFGHACIYCERDLEHDRAAVEHLEGMNRFRAGLHVPGNVAMACRRCNSEKRRDDQNPTLSISKSGWESFLSHDGSKCATSCMTCKYWNSVFPDTAVRVLVLSNAKQRILRFQEPFKTYTTWSKMARSSIQARAEALYRGCQEFATREITQLTSELSFDFTSFSSAES